MQWKVHYDDGSTYSDLDGSPETAPGDGVQVIIQLSRDHGFDIIRGGNQGRRDDFYWWDADSGAWFVGDYIGLILHLRRPGWRKVMFGSSVSDPRFDAILKAACNDPDFPPKTGYRKFER